MPESLVEPKLRQPLSLLGIARPHDGAHRDPHACRTGLDERRRQQAAAHDLALGDHLLDALREEVLFHDCILRRRQGAATETVQAPCAARGELCVSVQHGVVTLAGEVPALAHRRLAGVLAWWVPGTRDVVDALAVACPEASEDEALTESVRMALEKDPAVDATQIRVKASRGVVKLEGLVWSDAERSRAEADARYVLDVAGVVNAVRVAASA